MWQHWFAWHPVRTVKGKWAFLSYVMRRKVTTKSLVEIDHEKEYKHWEYL